MRTGGEASSSLVICATHIRPVDQLSLMMRLARNAVACSRLDQAR